MTALTPGPQLPTVKAAHWFGCLEGALEKKALTQHNKDLSSIPSSSAYAFVWDCGGTLWTIKFSTTEKYCVQRLWDGVWTQVWRGHILLNPRSYSVLSTEHFFVLLLSVSVSESPSPLSLLWLGFQLWMLPLTTSVIPRQPTYPCLPPLMCDLMYCLTVFPPFKINCSFISPQDKKACREHNSLKVVWILFKQNN